MTSGKVGRAGMDKASNASVETLPDAAGSTWAHEDPQATGRPCDCAVKIDIDRRGDVHIHNCVGSSRSGSQPRLTDASRAQGACLPVVAGAKHKQSREQRLHKIAHGSKLPSSLASNIVHMSRRFLLGKEPANPLERTAFRILGQTSPLMRDVLSCAIKAFDEIPSGQRSQLFDTSLIMDPDHAVSQQALSTAWMEEVVGRAGDLVFGDTQGLKEERPGQVRIFEPGDDAFLTPVRICRLNGLRTRNFRPGLDAGDYLPAEIQQVCEVQLVDGNPQVTCQVQTTDCPGNQAAGVCLRVPEIAAGDSAVLEGVNFFSTDTTVRLTATGPTELTRDVDTHVWGDVDTPVTETIDGQSVLIMDCRVHDRLTFQIPEDLPPDTYQVTVVVPNITGIAFWGESLSSDAEYITVLPPPTARFTISSETLHAESETSPAWAGSDEVGLHVIAVAMLTDFTAVDTQELAPGVRLGNVDSGDTRDINRTLFKQQQPIAFLAMGILGHEVDSEDAYEQLITEWTDVFVDLVKQEIKWIAAGLGAAGGLSALGKLGPWGWLAVGIALAVALAIDLIIALWAPADLIIEDTIVLTAVELTQLTNPNFPPPSSDEYTSAQGIDVLREALGKLPTQYREQRTYHSADEESRYQLTLRINQIA
jgi:hypothetical protein